MVKQARAIGIVRWDRGRLVAHATAVDAGSDVLSVRYAGLCPSELSLAPDCTFGLGHELVVERDRRLFLLAPFATCGHCPECEGGRFKYCLTVECPSLSWNGDGGLGGEVLLRDERFLLPLPATSMPHVYVLAEPAAAGAAAVSRVESEMVVVIGLGAVGIGAVLAATDRGLDVVAVGRHGWQREMARTVGAEYRAPDALDPLGAALDIVIAADGVDALRLGAEVALSGGRVHLVGMNTDDSEWRAEAGGGYPYFRRELVLSHHYMYSLQELQASIERIRRHESELQDALIGPLSLSQLGYRFPEQRLGRRVVVACNPTEDSDQC